MSEKTHWKKLSNPSYIGSYAFQPGESKNVTITTVTCEMVTGPEGRKEERSVLHFAGDIKPMILNATNAKTIQKLLRTPYIEEWAGKTITLVVETVSAYGERVDAVRVKNVLPVVTAPACTECGQDIRASGKFSARQITQAGVNRFGRVVCLDCAKTLKAVDISAPPQDAPPQDAPPEQEGEK